MLCGFGVYAKIYRILNTEEVIKVNRHQHDFLGIRYPAEYDIATRLKHPHLIRAKRITEEGYLVFPYYQHNLSRDKILRLPLPQRKLLLKQLISAVDYLHDNGYLHLDIKGDNVLVSKNKDHLVLADFGAALFISNQESKISSRDRIPDYLKAPELLQMKIQGKTKFSYNRALDYWSLGLLCLDVLTGKLLRTKRKSIVDIYEEMYYLFSNPAAKKRYLSQLLPDEEEWQDNLSLLLQWDPSKRILPFMNFSQPGLALVETPVLHWEERVYKRIITRLLVRLAHNFVIEKVEAFFLGVDLFMRCYYLSRPKDKLALTCFWLAIKTVEGVSVDPREIEPNEDVTTLWLIELEVIRELGGRLYYPNLFTSAQSSKDLIIAWRYLYSDRRIKDFGGKESALSLQESTDKSRMTLMQYYSALRGAGLL